VLVDHQRGLPLPDRSMQDETTVGLHRSAEENRQIGETFACRGTSIFSEKRPQTHVDRPIDDHPQRASLVVFGDVDQGLGKIGVHHCRHGNEKMVSQVDALHGLILIGAVAADTKVIHDEFEFWSGFGATCVIAITRRSARRCGVGGASIVLLSSIGRSSTGLGPDDRRVEFIRESLVELDLALRVRGRGNDRAPWLGKQRDPETGQGAWVSAVFANRDYEPQAKKRDAAVSGGVECRRNCLRVVQGSGGA
jgi:hypothetical protein